MRIFDRKFATIAVALAVSACDPAVEPRWQPGTTATPEGDDGTDDEHDDGGGGVELACNYRTQTQGGWGSRCSKGLNPGCLRDHLFPKLLADGLEIGAGEHARRLWNGDVEDDLPAGGPPRPFTGDDDDRRNVLYGQTVALALNVRFDGHPAFNQRTTPVPLAELVVARKDSPCLGMTVAAVLEQAHAALGGADGLTPDEINACATLINESFVNGGLGCIDALRLPERARLRAR